jgi:CelD/BcsL family acetyltransferase involved in cellulose biosynthesis
MPIALKKKEIKIKTESFERFESFFLNQEFALNWNCLFVLPVWLKTWWDTFGGHQDPEILTGYCDGKLIGLAPLRVDEKTARFIGSENVCDYQDMVVTPNHHQEFLEALLSYLKKKEVGSLELDALRPDSVSLKELPNIAKRMGHTVVCDSVGVGSEIELPSTWESYLQMIGGKQRHEIRRKLRRLDEAGHVRFRVIKRPEEISEHMDIFFSLFKASRPDKNEFMTDAMLSFFLKLAQNMAQHGFFRMSFLDIDRVPAAGVMCFDYNNTIFLYNNGYDPQFGKLSVGLISKVYSIRDSIEQKRPRYDLLKGNEVYKKRLGSTPVPLYRLKIDLEGVTVGSIK